MIKSRSKRFSAILLCALLGASGGFLLTSAPAADAQVGNNCASPSVPCASSAFKGTGQVRLFSGGTPWAVSDSAAGDVLFNNGAISSPGPVLYYADHHNVGLAAEESAFFGEPALGIYADKGEGTQSLQLEFDPGTGNIYTPSGIYQGVAVAVNDILAPITSYDDRIHFLANDHTQLNGAEVDLNAPTVVTGALSATTTVTAGTNLVADNVVSNTATRLRLLSNQLSAVSPAVLLDTANTLNTTSNLLEIDNHASSRLTLTGAGNLTVTGDMAAVNGNFSGTLTENAIAATTTVTAGTNVVTDNVISKTATRLKLLSSQGATTNPAFLLDTSNTMSGAGDLLDINNNTVNKVAIGPTGTITTQGDVNGVNGLFSGTLTENAISATTTVTAGTSVNSNAVNSRTATTMTFTDSSATTSIAYKFIASSNYANTDTMFQVINNGGTPVASWKGDGTYNGGGCFSYSGSCSSSVGGSMAVGGNLGMSSHQITSLASGGSTTSNGANIGDVQAQTGREGPAGFLPGNLVPSATSEIVACFIPKRTWTPVASTAIQQSVLLDGTGTTYTIEVIDHDSADARVCISGNINCTGVINTFGSFPCTGGTGTGIAGHKLCLRYNHDSCITAPTGNMAVWGDQ